MYHLGTRIGLLVVVGHGYGVELALRVIPREDARGVFPCDGRPCLHLCPRQLAVGTTAVTALGDEVVHTATALGIAGVPVLHGAVLHLGTLHHYNLHDGGMQLVLITHRSRAALEVRHIAVVIGHDERTLKLARIGHIDAEVGA